MKYTLLALAAAGFAAAMLSSAPSKAASFNCVNATLPAEVAVCNNRQLSRLDEQMAGSYFSLINAAPGWAVGQIKSQQASWLNRRNSCGYDIGCLRGAYYSRIGVLDGWHGHLGV